MTEPGKGARLADHHKVGKAARNPVDPAEGNVVGDFEGAKEAIVRGEARIIVESFGAADAPYHGL